MFINPLVFKQIDLLRGPHSVDRFASHLNAQLPGFNSRFLCPRAEAVDAFTVNWSGENNWWCPPPMLVPRVVRHAEACGASGTLGAMLGECTILAIVVSSEGFASFVVKDTLLKAGWL